MIEKNYIIILFDIAERLRLAVSFLPSSLDLTTTP